MKVETATNVKLHFGEMLDNAMHEPIAIQKSGRQVAVLMSIREFQKINEMLEDKYWGEKATVAHKKGDYAGIEESEKLLKKLLKNAQAKS